MKSRRQNLCLLAGLFVLTFSGTPSYAQKPMGVPDATQIENGDELQFLRDRSTPRMPVLVLSGRLQSVSFQGTIVIQGGYLENDTVITTQGHPLFPESGDIIVTGTISCARNRPDEELNGLNESDLGFPTPGSPGQNGFHLEMNAAHDVKIFADINLAGQNGGSGGWPDLFHCEEDSYSGQAGGMGGRGGNLNVTAGRDIQIEISPLISPSLQISTQGGNGGSGSSAPNFPHTRPQYIPGLDGGDGNNGGQAGNITLTAGANSSLFQAHDLPKISIRGSSSFQASLTAAGGVGGAGGSGSQYTSNGGDGGFGGSGGNGGKILVLAPRIEGRTFEMTVRGNSGGDAGSGGSGWRGGRYECGCNEDLLCGPGGPGGSGGNGGNSGNAGSIKFNTLLKKDHAIRLADFALSASASTGGVGGDGGAAGGTFLNPYSECPIQYESAGNGGLGGAVGRGGALSLESNSVNIETFTLLTGTAAAGSGGNGGDNAMNVCVQPSICERGGDGGHGGQGGREGSMSVFAIESLTVTLGFLDYFVVKGGDGGNAGRFNGRPGLGGVSDIVPFRNVWEIFVCRNTNDWHLENINVLFGHEVGPGSDGAEAQCPNRPR